MICQGLTRVQSNNLYIDVLQDKDEKALKRLCLEDLFFLLTVACKRKDIDRDWLYERCREVEKDPNGYLDLWFREGYKSTLITFGQSIKDILNNPNITIGIFSHTRPIAKGFLDQIKRELENNTFLQSLFPEVLWSNARSEAAKWSLDSGIIVKRTENPKEATVEAWGLVDGQPTSKHFSLLIYDDVVTRESVTTPDQIKKTTEAWELSLNLAARGGHKRYIGTRYHANDSYRTMIDRGSVMPRIKPATEDGKMDGKSVFLESNLLLEKRRDMGPYTFACFPSGAPVLMADWTEKPIEELIVGDYVVGYSLEPKKKAKLTKSKVLAVNTRMAQVVEAILESGRVIKCTPDHKWYTGRRGPDIGGSDTHLTYVALGFGAMNTKSLISIYDPRIVNKDASDMRAAGYLAGFFDGEGSTSGKSIHFHQSCEKNLHICDKLENSLKALSFDFGMTQIDRGKSGWQAARDYYLRGGRSEQLRFLRQCRPAKSDQISKMLFDNGTRNFGKNEKDRLVFIRELGERKVYNIQTETGNFVCYGYATKNCQMLQDPVADRAMGFKEEWLSHYEILKSTESWNKYILVDPASQKKKTSDYTVMLVVGLAPDNNYYLLDGIRDRLNLTQRADKLFELHRKWKPLKVGYERYGMQSDIEHIKYVMEQVNYRFNILELGGSMAKEDRIKMLVPPFEQKRMILPRRLEVFNYEGRRVDLIQSFIHDEYLAFPVCIHDDMLDCMARILDPELHAEFPQIEKPKPKVVRPYNPSGQGWMG